MAGDLRFIKKVTSTSSAASISMTDAFSTDYTNYVLVLNHLDISGAGGENIGIRLLDSSNTEITATEYEYAAVNTRYSGAPFYLINSNSYGGSTRTTAWWEIGYMSDVSTANVGWSAIIYTPYNSSSFTHIISKSATDEAATMYQHIGTHASAEQINGLSICVDSGVIDECTFSIYGLN